MKLKGNFVLKTPSEKSKQKENQKDIVKRKRIVTRVVPITIASLAFAGLVISYFGYQNRILKNQLGTVKQEKIDVQQILQITKSELEEIKNQDQVKRNDELQTLIEDIQTSYDTAVSVYEDLVKIKESSEDTEEFDDLFTQSLVYLSEKEYASASAVLKELSTKITDLENEIAAAQVVVPVNVPVNNSPPGAGYSRQTVQTDAGSFLVSMVAADIGSTKVIVDTASDSDCSNDCPVLPLATYVSRNGAFAGVNGTYFCPATYPSCAGKTGSFDLLVMNKNKHYFNSGNNVYSNNPAVIFGNGYVRFVTAASQWGRDTGVDGVISNFPLLVFNSSITFGGDDDPKKGSKGNRSFVASKGNTVYIGVVHSATVAESARVMQALGMENAMNLDNGGSTALWSGGYKVGPGRNLPNVILFVSK